MGPLAVLALILVAGFLYLAANVQAAPGMQIALNLDRVGPRQVEEQTEKAIRRDYGAAWAGLSKALERNQSESLGDLWTGFARQQMMDAIQQQKQSGLRVRYVDLGHKLDGLFYSPEGSALQLRDTASLQREVLDGDQVIISDRISAHYLVVMTPTSDHWQVRILQSVPE